MQVLKVVGPERAVELFGVRLLGLDAHHGRKMLLTLVCVLVLVLLNAGLRWLFHVGRDRPSPFWARQGVSLLLLVLGVLLLGSVWFEDSGRLATDAGLIGAAVAFALQKLVLSFAGYFIILRGKTFTVGDRVLMGGVRGDVIALRFFQTVLRETGVPFEQGENKTGVWVPSRQFTGRIVTVPHSSLFEHPVYNYSREFPYFWQELGVPISYKDDRRRVERILLEAAHDETQAIRELPSATLEHLAVRFGVSTADMAPRVFLRLTDKWVELTVRVLVPDADVRAVRDRMARRVIDALDAAGIRVASATYDIVGLPPVVVHDERHPPKAELIG